METVLNIASHIPWELLIVVVALPYLRRQTKKIKQDELRTAYIHIIRWVEQEFGGGASNVKKAAALDKITEKKLEIDDVLLESVVNEFTLQAKKAAAVQPVAA